MDNKVTKEVFDKIKFWQMHGLDTSDVSAAISCLKKVYARYCIEEENPLTGKRTRIKGGSLLNTDLTKEEIVSLDIQNVTVYY